MKIIIPMAGMGKRMRPHTLTIPKPLIQVAGKPIVQRLVEDIVRVCDEPVDEIAFIIGNFGEETENKLKHIAQSVGAKGSIYYQEKALGTAHAILCAQEALKGKVVIAFADTLFKADFVLDSSQDGIIWVQKIEDPRQFGVVKLDNKGKITDFVEKPQEFVSDMAIIGIYYFKDGENLKNELQYLIDNDIKEKGEYQLTNALENMKNNGKVFRPKAVTEWLDCGNKDATVNTNARVLEIVKDREKLVSENISNKNSIIIEPCYIGDGVVLENSVVGPFASIGSKSIVKNSVVSNSIVQNSVNLEQVVVTNSMIGSHAVLKYKPKDLSLSDYSTIQE